MKAPRLESEAVAKGAPQPKAWQTKRDACNAANPVCIVCHALSLCPTKRNTSEFWLCVACSAPVDNSNSRVQARHFYNQTIHQSERRGREKKNSMATSPGCHHLLGGSVVACDLVQLPHFGRGVHVDYAGPIRVQEPVQNGSCSNVPDNVFDIMDLGVLEGTLNMQC